MLSMCRQNKFIVCVTGLLEERFLKAAYEKAEAKILLVLRRPRGGLEGRMMKYVRR